MTTENNHATPGTMLLNPDVPFEREMMLAERQFGFLQRQAQMQASSKVVPKAYQTDPKQSAAENQQAVANCAIAIELAQRMGASPLEIMQNLVTVQQKPTFYAKYLIARVNQSGILTDRLTFEFEDLGEKTVTYEYTEWINNQKTRKTGTATVQDRRCRALGTNRKGQVLEGTWVSIEMAVKEGWYTKDGSKWKTMPELMLQYRAASFWTSVHAPDATMGMPTREEIEDISGEERDITPPMGESANDILKKAREAKQKSTDPIEGESVRVQEAAEKIYEAVEAVEVELNELAGAEQPPPMPGYSAQDLVLAMESAKTLDELDEAASFIGSISSATWKTKLNALYEKRVDELNTVQP